MDLNTSVLYMGKMISCINKMDAMGLASLYNEYQQKLIDGNDRSNHEVFKQILLNINSVMTKMGKQFEVNHCFACDFLDCVSYEDSDDREFDKLEYAYTYCMGYLEDLKKIVDSMEPHAKGSRYREFLVYKLRVASLDFDFESIDRCLKELDEIDNGGK